MIDVPREDRDKSERIHGGMTPLSTKQTRLEEKRDLMVRGTFRRGHVKKRGGGEPYHFGIGRPKRAESKGREKGGEVDKRIIESLGWRKRRGSARALRIAGEFWVLGEILGSWGPSSGKIR